MADIKQDGNETVTNTSMNQQTQPEKPGEMVCHCYQPQAETIGVEQVLATQMQQKIVEVDLIVPKSKPSIKQVIDVYVKKLRIKQVDVMLDRVVIRGNMEVKVMYVADLPNEPVHAFEKEQIKFIRDIEVAGAMPEMKATADCTVEYVNYDFNICDPRKIHITVVLKFWTRVMTVTELDVLALSSLEGEEVTVEEAETTAGTDLSINGKTGMVTGNSVNIRTGPGMNYPSIIKVNKGDMVTIKEKAFGWYKVVLTDKNTTGWIAGWFVDIKV